MHAAAFDLQTGQRLDGFTYNTKAYPQRCGTDVCGPTCQVERRFAEVEAGFAKNLELLKQDVLNEVGFRKANEARRDERARLEARQVELPGWPAQQHDRPGCGGLPTSAVSARSSRTLGPLTHIGPRP